MFLRVAAELRRTKKRQARQQNVAPQRDFSKNMHKFAPDVPLVVGNPGKDLFRGIRYNVFDQSTHVPLFRDAGILLGVSPYFSSFFPNETVITNYIAAAHKNLHLFTSTSYEKTSSDRFTCRGKEASVMLILDFSSLPDVALIDIEKAYFNVHKKKYANGEEHELTVLGFPYTSIAAFDINNNLVPNPFYLPISAQDEKLCRLNQELYDSFCNMTHMALMEETHPEIEMQYEWFQSKKDYFEKLFSLSEMVHGKDNPFNMTINQFITAHPQYAKFLFHHKNGDYAMRLAGIKDIDKNKVTVLEFITNHDDIDQYLRQLKTGSHRRSMENIAQNEIRRDEILKEAFKIR